MAVTNFSNVSGITPGGDPGAIVTGGFADPPPSDFVSNGAVMFLDASDATTFTLSTTRVDEWRDKLGSANKIATVTALGTGFNPVRTASLFGNRGGVVFNGAKYLESVANMPLNGTTGWTVLAVIKRTARGGWWISTDFDRQPMLGVFSSERFGVGTFEGTRHGVPSTASFVIGAQNPGSAAPLKYIRNGVGVARDQGAFVPATGAFGKIQLGGWQGAAGGASFDLAGIIYYNRVLTEPELVKMDGWLRTYYGVSSVPEPTWNIVADGNSHTIGQGGTNVATINEGIIAANGSPLSTDWLCMGSGGASTTFLAGRAAATIDPLYNSTIAANKRILIFWEGTNHIATTISNNAATFYDAIKNYCIARKAVGWKVIVGTILPRNGASNTDYETVRLAVNQSIRDAKAANETWLDAVADVGGDATIGATGAASNTTYYVDGIHMKDAGHTIAKALFTTAINAVTGL